MNEPYEIVCDHCGSNAVNFDAFAQWDVDKQELVLSNTFDNCFCRECGGECGTRNVPLSIYKINQKEEAYSNE